MVKQEVFITEEHNQARQGWALFEDHGRKCTDCISSKKVCRFKRQGDCDKFERKKDEEQS